MVMKDEQERTREEVVRSIYKFLSSLHLEKLVKTIKNTVSTANLLTKI
jgi:hypothetical protein